MARQISVAMVDDHPLLRRGLRETLGECADFKLVAEGANADDAVAIAQDHKPDVMLLDVNMPGSGLTAVERIAAKNANIKLVMLSVYDNLSNVRQAMTSGASGYVLKGVDGDQLVDIIKSVHAGAKYVVPELAARLFSEQNGAQGLSVEEQFSVRFKSLTQREQQILSLIGKGKPNADIAKKLKLSEATVKHYITPLFRKLGVNNRTEAALLIRSQN